MAGKFPGRYTNGRFYKGNSRNERKSERYDEFHDGTSRPSTSQAGGSYSDRNKFNKSATFKSNNRGGNCKSWDKKSDLVREQLDTQFSSQNGQPRNNSGQQSYPHMKIPVDKKEFRNSSIILRKSFLTGFYIVKVQNVEDSDQVLKIIQTYITPIVFYPYNKQYADNTLSFLVDDYTVANALHNSSHKITQRDDRKLTIKVLPYFPTVETRSCTPVSNEVREKMVEAFETRYNSSTKYLDLSKFYACKLFTDNQLFVPLNQPAFLLAAFKIIAQHTNNDLYGLSLENNHIYLDEGLHWIHKLFHELKVLDLGGNKFTNLNQLKSVSGYTIEVLNLSSNPVCYTKDYRRAILCLFPMLNKLDNLELPFRESAIIGSKFKMPVNLGDSFPISDSHNLEESKPIITFVEMFLAKYYKFYDNRWARKKVAEAYHENATFSLSSCILSETHRGCLGKYLPKSRNLLSTDDQYKQVKAQNVHKGRKNILKFLVKLPITKHDFGSFIVDVPIANTCMVQIILNGVFSEEYKKADHRRVYRSFCRTFCLVPVGSDWSILSDLLFVTTVNNELLFESAKRFYGFGKANNTKREEISTIEITEQMFCMESPYQQSSTLNYPPTSFYHQSIFTSCWSLPMMNQQSPHLNQKCRMQASIPQVEQQMVPAATTVSSQLDTKKQLTTSFPMYNAIPASMTKFPTTSTPVSLPVNQSLTGEHVNVISDICANPDKLAMVKSFSTESGMNKEWAKKCLEENGWDYAKAALRFADLKANIPPVAFIH